jgi:hypothetical protein
MFFTSLSMMNKFYSVVPDFVEVEKDVENLIFLYNILCYVMLFYFILSLNEN